VQGRGGEIMEMEENKKGRMDVRLGEVRIMKKCVDSEVGRCG